jgi:hypothetical protein
MVSPYNVFVMISSPASEAKPRSPFATGARVGSSSLSLSATVLSVTASTPSRSLPSSSGNHSTVSPLGRRCESTSRC